MAKNISMFQNTPSNSLAASQVAHIFVCDEQGLPLVQAKKQELLCAGQSNIDLYCLSQEQQDMDLWPVFERVSRVSITVCGATALIEMVRDLTGHWPPEQLNFTDVQFAVAAQAVNESFEVVLRQSGLRVQVDAELSLLEALRFEGIHIASSCESGTCGTCKTRLISGCADHRDHVLRPQERDAFIMPCVSRALAGQLLVLEL